MNLFTTVQRIVTDIELRKNCSHRLACRWLAMVLNGVRVHDEIMAAVDRMLGDD